jgi:1-deoxy-D-xylulose-5-phosphate reductoisomerase
MAVRPAARAMPGRGASTKHRPLPVEFEDGAMLAHLAPPSMVFPIQHALLYPERAPGVGAPLELQQLFALDFRPVDESHYPCMRLARAAMLAGGVAPAVFNAANEVAVTAFLAGRVPFLAIPKVIDKTLESISNYEPADLDSVLEADGAARRFAQDGLARLPV